jgi:GTP cyclohydrolase I
MNQSFTKINYKRIYDGLPIKDSWPNRGKTDYKKSADLLGITVEQLKKVKGILQGMYARQPESTLTIIEFCKKIKESSISIDDIGFHKGKYQSCRHNDEGGYHYNSFDFKLFEENQNEKKKQLKDFTSKRVYTPVGEFSSLEEASKILNMKPAAIQYRINSGDKKYQEWYYPDEISKKIIRLMKSDEKRFFSNDNISEYLNDEIKELLLKEATKKFDCVLSTLLIDIENDPNAKGTGNRLAKMYLNELMSGRYEKLPNVTSFPNDGMSKYTGMLVVRAEIKSICSHHHQPVQGVAYIGVIAGKRVLGLSKYIRIAQWVASRGTLQEELTTAIATEIQAATECKDVAVYIEATHGCCENRGVKAHSSLTQTTCLYGQFKEADVKKEFFDNIMLQKQLKG